ncbi:MAG TPA: hypothetical protein VHA79_13550 [Mycobacteriales bacterium]|nr:hypothetical protein [Mycobacteriales bacterium]
MDRPRRHKRPVLREYGERCSRCATQLPVTAAVCTGCGISMTIPVQLPAPRPAAA